MLESSVTPARVPRSASDFAAPVASWLMLIACHSPPARRHCGFRPFTTIGLLVAILGQAAGCNGHIPEASPAADPPWFEDVTSRVGLDFVHDAGATGSYFMPQLMGSGAALFDFDDDGRLDIYIV